MYFVKYKWVREELLDQLVETFKAQDISTMLERSAN